MAACEECAEMHRAIGEAWEAVRRGLGSSGPVRPPLESLEAEIDALHTERDAIRRELGNVEEVAGQWMLATRAERARAERAEARAKAGELLASQVLDLMEWLDALADRCDEDLENEARASIGSLALTAASAKAEEIIAGPAQGEVLSEKYAEELVRRTRALAQKETR